MKIDASEQLLDFALSTDFDSLPHEVIERSRCATLDTLGTIIAGRKGEGVGELATLYRNWGGRADATELIFGTRMPAPHATFLNATAGRAWDLDDVHEQNTCHISVGLVPTLLACAELTDHLTGKEYLAALSVSAEVATRLSSAHRISISETGGSLTYQCGFFGAALAASRALRLNKQQGLHALGLAHARVAGNLQGYQSGALSVRVMQGVAAEGGLLSALFAQQGITGSTNVLEGRFGYFHFCHRSQYDRNELVSGLGSSIWRMLEISYKPPYPCCKFTHGPIDATIDAATELNCSADELETISISVTNQEVFDLVCGPQKDNPTTVTDAQFSIPFVVAHAFIHKSVGFNTFQDAGLRDPAVRKLLGKVRVVLDVPSGSTGVSVFPMPGIVQIRTKTGTTITKRVNYVKGHPRNPMSFDDVAEKFKICTDFAGLDERITEDLIDCIGELHSLKSISTPIKMLTQRKPQAANR